MPWNDPQFWMVSVLALASIAQIVRPLVAKDKSPCSSCALSRAPLGLQSPPTGNLVRIGSAPVPPNA